MSYIVDMGLQEARWVPFLAQIYGENVVGCRPVLVISENKTQAPR